MQNKLSKQQMDAVEGEFYDVERLRKTSKATFYNRAISF